MKHINTGSVGHTNTGYVDHNNTYGNHVNTYSNHTNTYGNHSNYNYSQGRVKYTHLSDKEIELINAEYNPSEDIDYSIYTNPDYEIMPLSNFSYGAYNQYGRHTNTGASHTNTGSGTPNYKQYTQSGSGDSNYKQYTQSGYSNHNNTGYTNHINTNINKEPTPISEINLGTFAYYKDTIKLIWQKATDNNKCISCVSASYGVDQTNTGIFEQGTKKVQCIRGTTIGYWDSNGIWKGYISKDTYSSIGLISELQTYFNSIPNGSFVAFASYDSLFPTNDDLATYRNFLSAYGFTKTRTIEGTRSAFAGILKKGTGVLSENVHRYGINPVNAGMISAHYTIPNVPSGQTMKYIIEYAFRAVGQSSYGSWTKIGETTSLEYSYNLANHGNGFIKFRIIASDGVESSTLYTESKEVRILKYTAPSMPTTNKGDLIKASDFNTIIVEINKLAEATGTSKTSLQIVPGDIILKSHANELNEKHSILNDIVKKDKKIIDVNGLVKATDVQNLKDWLKKI